MKNLNIRAFALAAGILWGVGVASLVILSMYTPIASQWVALLGDGYIGVGSSWNGAVLGALWGFGDAAIGAAIFAWLYNKLI